MVHEQLSAPLPGFPPRRAPDGGAWSAWSARCRPSITTRSTSTNPEHRKISAFRLIAKMPTHRRDGVQVLDRPAVHVSAERPVLHRQLHAHDVRRAGRGVQGQRRCWCARWTASSSCTPTTSRTRRPRRCGSPGSSGANPFACIAAASPACGGRRTAARTKRPATCSRRSATSRKRRRVRQDR